MYRTRTSLHFLYATTSCSVALLAFLIMGAGSWLSLPLHACCVPLVAQSQSGPEGFTKLNIGDAAPDFELPGVDDKDHGLEEYQSSKVLMVVFTCNHCPTAQAYEKRLNQIYDDYHQNSVAVVAISPNDPQAVRLDELGYSDLGDTLADMKIRAAKAGFKFPYLYDGETQKTSLAFGVLATPQVFIFDADRKLRYKGRIDDSEEGSPQVHDARNALDALLADKNVPVEVTKVFGCSTKWFTKRDSSQKAISKWNKEPVTLSEIDVEELSTIVANDSEKFRLVNVWATWCAPCVKELPEFVTINRMYRGRKFEMITISADKSAAKDAAHETLTKLNVSCRNILFDSGDRDELFEGLDPEWEGGLPYTVLIAPGGEIVFRKQGEIDAMELRHFIADKVGRTFASDKRNLKPEPASELLPPIKVGDNFKTENLVPWCTVAFDAKQRTPVQRAKMIIDLGMKRSGYAWRKKHLPEFEQEIEAYKENDIEYFAFFNWHDSMEPLIRKHNIKPQIWHYMQRNPPGTQEEKIAEVAASIKDHVDKTRELGLKFGLYNHRDWTGDPDNMIAVIEHIRTTQPNSAQPDSDHVGIVYNFHHGHLDIPDFEAKFNRMLPYLLCVNINGMVDAELVNEKTLENKILTLGTGVHEHAMIKVVAESGYSGPIGIIDHRNELDSEVALRENIKGLQDLISGKARLEKVNPSK